MTTDTDSKSKNKTSENIVLCPRFHYAVELIGKRWTGAIINILLQSEISQIEDTQIEDFQAKGTRFHDIRVAIPELSDRMLSERLKELEVADIIVREVYPDIPVRVEYKLTDKGQSLKSIVNSIGQWAEEWVE